MENEIYVSQYLIQQLLLKHKKDRRETNDF